MSITVLRALPATTIQDLGRPGLLHLGVPRSGAADRPAALRANRLVGNSDGAAVIEATLGSVTLRFEQDASFALTGAPSPARLDAGPAASGLTHAARAGQVLRLGMPSTGLRTYIAVAGGIAVELVLGSRSTDTLLGIGPPPLRAGDALMIGAARGDAAAAASAHDLPAGRSVLEVVIGPREDQLTAAALATLLSERFTATPQADRVGIRLAGPPLAWRDPGAHLPSEPVAPGSIQIPPDGQPIVLLVDHPSVGGYPVVAVLTDAALAFAAQLRPGRSVRFGAAG